VRSGGTLDLGAANAVAAAVLAAAAAGRQVSVAVVDDRGHDLVVLRGDGAAWFTPGIARAKAASAAAMRSPTAALADLRATYPELVDLVDGQLARPLTTLPGGVPLLLDGRHVGGLGVSGAHPDEDVGYAEQGAAALVDRRGADSRQT
jgi:glc operon protein GlcG